MADRPHSRKKKVAEGTAQVKKGVRVNQGAQAGSGLVSGQGQPGTPKASGRQEEKR